MNCAQEQQGTRAPGGWRTPVKTAPREVTKAAAPSPLTPSTQSPRAPSCSRNTSSATWGRRANLADTKTQNRPPKGSPLRTESTPLAKRQTQHSTQSDDSSCFGGAVPPPSGTLMSLELKDRCPPGAAACAETLGLQGAQLRGLKAALQTEVSTCVCGSQDVGGPGGGPGCPVGPAAQLLCLSFPAGGVQTMTPCAMLWDQITVPCGSRSRAPRHFRAANTPSVNSGAPWRSPLSPSPFARCPPVCFQAPCTSCHQIYLLPGTCTTPHPHAACHVLGNAVWCLPRELNLTGSPGP